MKNLVVRLANKSFTNLSQLEAYLNEKIQIALDKNVAPVVKESIQTAVSDVVYGAGVPIFYKRRNLRNGSLGDVGEMNHEISGNTLIVTDDAKSKLPWENGRSLAQNIEYGYGENWYSVSRPFINGEDGAKNILREDKSHIESLKDGLRELGLTVI